MSKNKTYSDQFKDPRWQRKRLEIMEKWRFECENCGDGDKTLNVHHLIYRKGRDIWDYPDDELKCFCEPCHKRWHKYREKLLEDLCLIEKMGLGIEEVEWFLMWKAHSNRNALDAVMQCLIYDKTLDDEIAESYRTGEIKTS